MDQDQERFLNELLNDFRIEASEHYQAIVDGLIMLENSYDSLTQQSTIEKIFREVHSLKGAARAVNLLDIEKLCTSLENVFSSLKKGELRFSLPLLDNFHKAADLLRLFLNDVNQFQKDGSKYNLMQIIKNLEFVHSNSGWQENEQPALETFIKEKSVPIIGDEISNNPNLVNNYSGSSESMAEFNNNIQTKENLTVRISTDKLSNILRQSEELISVKSTFSYFIKELQALNYQYFSWNLKSDEKISDVQNSISSSVIGDSIHKDKKHRKRHGDDLIRLIRELNQFQFTTNKIVDELVYDIKTSLLFPFSSLLGLFPKIVRDLSKEYSKDIEIVIVGDSIEIDRRILEEMKDPLIHLIRNCVDHGIEMDKVRIAKGKPARGQIEIRIEQDADRKIRIQVKDDGAGIDLSRIIDSALKLGILKPGDADKLSEKEICTLIFQSGISASPFITDISGRGLGIAIVAEKVTKLGGNIELETVKDSGTSFIISLPQTLATFRGVLFKSGGQHFILPSSAVEKVIRIQYADIVNVGSGQTMLYNNETLGLVLLSDVLGIKTNKKIWREDEYLQLIILSQNHKKIAFVVEEIFGEQEGLVKELGPQLAHINQVAGATIMGNGNITFILHPMELMNSAGRVVTSLEPAFEYIPESGNIEQKSILVVEDSITIRTLLRNFIENAGFKVTTAVDGLDAWQLLQKTHFDLIVSDIEMPKMNGFELTVSIRKEKIYADLPIILVTALETADDKQKGMEVGANAYVIKSSFEKSNLIEIIQRLI